MWNSKYRRLVRTACAASAGLAALGACGVEQVPTLVPHVEPTEDPARQPHLPSPEELELCFRRVPLAHC
jgi:hypothetical protein